MKVRIISNSGWSIPSYSEEMKGKTFEATNTGGGKIEIQDSVLREQGVKLTSSLSTPWSFRSSSYEIVMEEEESMISVKLKRGELGVLVKLIGNMTSEQMIEKGNLDEEEYSSTYEAWCKLEEAYIEGFDTIAFQKEELKGLVRMVGHISDSYGREVGKLTRCQAEKIYPAWSKLKHYPGF